ncbi:histidine kinase dimerization/phospho-acceptor domain-containing protein [Eubacterium sp. AB3007]|uniref:histidine kinase dimerization/phospho-acceptor domain-containing protein n=1 Tax=Eubacterium sp. AB3007 TaxID=1392487 RepID=UPI000483B179|nr:histidine kinase dimerization/phospho-acceptor domain-containing protein [Eubacterium sp. AB3007]
MARRNYIKGGLRNESIFSVVIAAIISLIFFYFLHTAGNMLLAHHFADEDVWKDKMADKAQELQSFITKNHLSSHDVREMNRWMQSQKGLFVYISNVGKKELIYDSEDYQGKQITNNESRPHYKLEFSDRQADLQLHWDYADRYFTVALVVEIVLTILLFLLIFLYFVYGKIRDIEHLEEQVGLLESGDLEHRVMIRGKDEIASLAGAIDDMRLALKENIDRSDRLLQANQELVTGMAHDLRTPLTTLLLYLELLQKEKYRDEVQMKQFIDTSMEKGRRIKTLSDDLFRQFLAAGMRQTRKLCTQSLPEAFEDQLSDVIINLEDQGFMVRALVDLPASKCVRVYTDDISRIMENICSNIQKYANAEEPVEIEVVNTGEEAVLRFRNRKTTHEPEEDSTHIGVRNIEIMMRSMGGRCEVKDDETYAISLFFPLFCVLKEAK